MRPGWYYFIGVWLALAACAPRQDLTPAQSLFDLQVRYTHLGAVVAQYVELPYCGPAVVVRCADETLVLALQAADQDVYALLLGARGATDTEVYLRLATVALSRLRVLVVEHAIREVTQ